MFDNFAPALGKNNRSANRMGCRSSKKAAIASRRLGISAHATFSDSLLWPYCFLAQQPDGLIDLDLKNWPNAGYPF